MYLLIETVTQVSDVAHGPLVMHFNSWIFSDLGRVRVCHHSVKPQNLCLQKAI